MDLKKPMAPSKVNIFFVFVHGTLYINGCEIQILTQEKKAFWKIFTLARFMVKKPPKNAYIGLGAIFDSFLLINQARVNIFQNAFFSWVRIFILHPLMYIVPWTNTKKILTLEGAMVFLKSILAKSV